MIRSAALALILAVFSPVLCWGDGELVRRGGLSGREFSEVGTLYLESDQKIHFRSSQKVYFLSHMYYIAGTLEKAGVVSKGKIVYDQPIRITGVVSKSEANRDFFVEPALRGNQIVWMDRVEKLLEPEELARKCHPIFNGKNLDGWSVEPSSNDDDPSWSVQDGSLAISSPVAQSGGRLMTDASYRDFELSFEYRSTWGNSASLSLRANEEGEGIGLGLDHVDGGNVGLPKSIAGCCGPFSLYETRITHGIGKGATFTIQYDGRIGYDGIAKDNLLEVCGLREYLTEWDGAYWNLVRVRCVGDKPIVTVWINGLLVCRFDAGTVSMQQKNPVQIGGIEKFLVNPEGRIGFEVHSTTSEKPEFLLREVRLEAL
ncbi:MAG: hypothetical protein ACI8XO_002378 [Verrucomicrobiales bacterium]|jgi:hypothetical protein